MKGKDERLVNEPTLRFAPSAVERLIAVPEREEVRFASVNSRSRRQAREGLRHQPQSNPTGSSAWVVDTV